MESKQIQKAGDNSQQTIVNNYYYGMSDEKARELYREQQELTLSACSEVAKAIAADRVNRFADQLLPKIHQIESDYQSFSDPAFQVLLRKAQLTAACTEREDDYKILSELLVHRTKNKSNTKKKASITKAVEILDQIDDDSLQALTVFHAMRCFAPGSGDISEGLESLDNLYGKLILDELPRDDLWIDNLSILGAITATGFAKNVGYEIHLEKCISGYVCVGIKKNSDEYEKAMNSLSQCGISQYFLVDNELLEGYVRLSIPRVEEIDEATFEEGEYVPKPIHLSFNDKQKETVQMILGMYSSNPELLKQVRGNFDVLLDKFSFLKKAISWYNSIQTGIVLTSVGRVIAHTNAKSIDSDLPDLD